MGDDHGNGICFGCGVIVGIIGMVILWLIVNHVRFV